MSSEFEQKLEKYAEVILKVGLNVQPGQRLLIGGPTLDADGVPLESAPLVRLIAKKAYQMGARLVDVVWGDEQLRLIRFQNAPTNLIEEYPKWKIDARYDISKAGDANLHFLSPNPELLSEVKPALISQFQTAFYKQMKHVYDLLTSNAFNWLIVSFPNDDWADKLFPDVPQNSRKDKLWDAIFEICRINHEDPISAWKIHNENLSECCKYLNQKQYTALKLMAPGTDLMIGLPTDHIWQGGSTTAQNGITFTGNIPTEEVYTMPHKDKVEGIVSTTKPVYYGGCTIENCRLRFSKGRIFEATAEKGEEFLLKTLETDEGACGLGEIALVPHSSPISQSGLLFYSMLIDENASNHIALGQAYRDTLKNGEALTDEEFMTAGGNNSLIHLDFMIGSGEMNVDGILEDDTAEPIMRNGEWAFKV
ncbi:MAG: aminopeptidase [Candidatus Lokiarchaeota archaeon]|nr:aminopeptidase [Candidatus Lokiarchaeota archaeon]